jgi:DNA repair exonuclease SbcCD nuclease subunit
MRIAFLSDIHLGDEQDLRAYHFALNLLKPLAIDKVFLGGDIFDHTSVSSYGKSLEAESRLQKELDEGFAQLALLRQKMPAAPIYFLPGNHENRLKRYLQGRARALQRLRVLDYESLYRLDELDFIFCPERVPVKFGYIYLAHGHEFSSGGRNPAYTALNDVNSNVLFGHVHRPSVSCKTELSGRGLVAYSNPCLSTLSPSYRLATGWAQGFSVVDITPRGYFSVTQYIFWRDEDTDKISTIIDGKLYRERKTV